MEAHLSAVLAAAQAQPQPAARRAAIEAAPAALPWRQAATDRRCVWVLDKLLALLPPAGLAAALRCMQSAVTELGPDPYGSKVLARCIVLVAKHFAASGEANDPLQANDPLEQAFVEMVEGLSGVLTLASWAKDPCATHVLRRVILVCAGCVPSMVSLTPLTATPEPWFAGCCLTANRFPVLPRVAACGRAVAARLQRLAAADRPHVLALPASAPVLALVLRVLQSVGETDALRGLVEAIVFGPAPPTGGPHPVAAADLDAVAAGAPGALLLEALLATAPGDLAEGPLYTQYVAPRLNFWACGAPPPTSGELSTGTLPVPSLPPAGRLTFLLTAAGSAKHFRPEKDAVQWRGRRDAHCRAAAAALWLREGQAFPGVDSCVLLYEDASLFRMTPDLVQRCPVPTEAQLIACWRDAALGKPIEGVSRSAAPPDGAASVGRVFRDLLGAWDAASTAVVLLHEDYPLELPVFGRPPQDVLAAVAPVEHVVFCLGAVRDMSEAEEAALVEACRALGVRCVGCNLGRTAEFTSKIIHALNGHHINGRLLPAVNVLASRIAEDPKAGLRSGPLQKLPAVPTGLAPPDAEGPASPAAAQAPVAPTVFHFVVLCPVPLHTLGPAAERRAELLPVVQACVCALWRSRVAGRSRAGQCLWITKLTLVCLDGGVLTLDGRLVEQLAEQHQAAPSEYQVLQALQESIAAQDAPALEAHVVNPDDPAAAKRLRRLLKQQLVLPYDTQPPQSFLIQVSSAAVPNVPSLPDVAYHRRCRCDHPAADTAGDGGVFLFLFDTVRPLAPNPPMAVQQAVHAVLRRACCAPPLPIRLSPPGVPLSIGLALSLLLHFHYHGRLVRSLRRLTPPPDPSGSARGPNSVSPEPASAPVPEVLPATAPKRPANGPALAAAAVGRLCSASLLRRVVKALDVEACLQATTNSPEAIEPVVRCLEACAATRDPSLCGRAFRRVLAALRLPDVPDDALWPALLALGLDGAESDGGAGPQPQPGGCRLVAALLKFPAAAVGRLVAGYERLLRQPAAPASLQRLGLDREGSRLLEGCLHAEAALSQELRHATVRGLAAGGGLGRLALDPSGGWVVSAAWRAVQDEPELCATVQGAVQAVEAELRRDKRLMLLRLVLGDNGKRPAPSSQPLPPSKRYSTATKW